MAIQLSGSLAITGSLVATGQIIAQTLNVQQVTSSIVYSSGSNIFGNSVSNTQQFTGSLQVSGSNSYILGNVGVGTTSPGVKLDVFGGQTRVSGSTNEQLVLDYATSSGGFTWQSFRINGTNKYRLVGNVDNSFGIYNDTLSAYALTIASTSAATFANALQVAGQQAAANYGGTGLNFDFTSGHVGRIASVKTTSGGSSLELHTYNTSGGDNNALVISNTGNVGIGTTSPGNRLHVTNTGGSLSTLTDIIGRFNATTNTAGQGSAIALTAIATKETGVILGAEHTSGNNGDFVVRIYNGGADYPERMRITSGGNVGIGTTSPTQLLSLSSANTLGTAINIINTSTGGYNWNIFSGGSDATVAPVGSLVFRDSTNGVSRMTISSAGNVGIGTTSPTTLIHAYAGASGATRDNGTYTQLVIEDNGDAGIHVVNPNTNIGRLMFGTPSNQFGGLVRWDYTNNNFDFATDKSGGYIRFLTDAFSEKMRITSGGNVGIGTTAPNSTLQVRGDNGSSVSAVVRLRDTNSTARTTRLQFEDYNGTLADGLIDFKIPTAGSAVGARLDIGVDSAIMSLVRGGNVGIGTTSPGDKLDVVGNIALNAGYKLYNGAANNSAGIDFDSSYVSLSGYNGIRFFASNTGVGSMSERMRITSGGNILINQTSDLSGGLTTSVQMSGLGISSPTTQASYQVHSFHGTNATWRGYYTFFKSRGTSLGSYTVVANGDDLGTIRWNGADGSGYVIGAEINAYVDGTPGVNDMPTRITFLTTADGASSPTERMRITSGGDLIVGATSIPGAGSSTTGVSLGASGYITAQRAAATVGYFGRSNDGELFAFYNNTTQVGNISVAASSTSYNTSSDYRLKQDLKDFNGLDLVSKIKTYDYEWKSDKTRSYGVIAHELQSVINYAVTGVKDGKEMQGVDYSKIVPVLVKAIQELTARVAELEPK
jgi:hypothetical protein